MDAAASQIGVLALVFLSLFSLLTQVIFLAKHYHRSLVLKGGKRRLGFGLAVAVSLLCSVAIPVPVMGFWTPHW